MLYRKTPSRAFTLSMALSVTAMLWVMWTSEGVSNEETLMLIAPQFCIMGYSVWGMTFSGGKDRWPARKPRTFSTSP